MILLHKYPPLPILPTPRLYCRPVIRRGTVEIGTAPPRQPEPPRRATTTRTTATGPSPGSAAAGSPGRQQDRHQVEPRDHGGSLYGLSLCLPRREIFRKGGAGAAGQTQRARLGRRPAPGPRRRQPAAGPGTAQRTGPGHRATGKEESDQGNHSGQGYHADQEPGRRIEAPQLPDDHRAGEAGE